MSTVTLPATAVPPLVADIGRLVGVLTEIAGTLSFDLEWFAKVPANLMQIPARRAEQWRLLTDLLATPVYTSALQNWYALPSGGEPTPIHLVLQPAADSGAGVVGVGLLHQQAQGASSLTASAFAPIFNAAETGAFVVIGAFPIDLSLSCKLEHAVTVGASAFDAVLLDCRVTVDGGAPRFSLAFTGPNGALAVIEGLQRLLQTDATGWINALLSEPFVSGWLDQPLGASSVTRGAALVGAGVLRDGKPYTLGDLAGLVGKGPITIAEVLLAAGLKTLAATGAPLLPIGKGGIWVFANPSADSTDYGLRLHVEDISLATAAGARFTLQAGKMLAADTDKSSWVSRSDPPPGAIVAPGVSLTLLSESRDVAPVPAFKATLDLVSVGLDVAGPGSDPLLDVKGVTLASAQARFLFSWDLANGPVYWGAAAQADRLGLPLGNGLGAGVNPVAQNLLSSGGASGGAEAVNPAFSLSVAGMSHPHGPTSLDVQLHSDSGSGDSIWIPVQRAFGPLQCSRIGVSWPSDDSSRRLDFLFDGGVSLAALKIGLQGLTLGIPLSSPGDLSTYALDLQGMGIAYSTGPVSVSGGFLKVAGPPIEYDGVALIKAAGWSIMATGSYATLTSGQPSMFVFAQLGETLGGPPFFFVTGLCAGFGYNRSLRVPTAAEAPSFPLLAGIANPGEIGGPHATPAEALAHFTDWIKPAQGVDWVAAGVQFTSFELVQSNAVVTAIVSNDFQAAILGVSRIKLAQTGEQFAYAELGLSAVVRPDDGYLGVSAVLSPNSYLLTADCHLSGGFAFWIWYAHDHAGDFVVTLGGYHPAFDPPPHYPIEPRLGFSWQVDSNVTVQGNSYFALTPSCAMGGGELQVLFHSGDLRAWFTAQADFLFNWKPFYFVGDVGVSIGASYKLDLLFTSVTVSVELGATLDIWGPPTGGRVHISWYIISFSVGFGADEQLPDGYQDWNGLVTLLPTAKPKQTVSTSATGAPDPAATGLISLKLSEGLLRTDGDAWLVRGDAMSFAVSTPIPATAAVLDGAQPYTFQTPAPGDAIAVRPMGVASATSVLTITIKGPDGKVQLGQIWSWTPAMGGAPESLWGPPLPEKATPTTPSAKTLPACLMGVTSLTPSDVAVTGPQAFPQTSLDFYVIDKGQPDWLPLSAGEQAAQPPPTADPGSLQTIYDSIMADAIATRRGDLYAALAGFGYDPGANGDLTAVRDTVDQSYPDPPMIGSPWREAA